MSLEGKVHTPDNGRVSFYWLIEGLLTMIWWREQLNLGRGRLEIEPTLDSCQPGEEEDDRVLKQLLLSHKISYLKGM